MAKNYPTPKKIVSLFFLLSNFKKSAIKVQILFLLFFVVFSFKGNAQCTISGVTVNSSTVSCATLSGCSIVYVGDGVNATTLVMNQNLNLTCLGAIQFIIRNNAVIDFSNGNYNLELGVNSSIIVENGGVLSAGSNCSASDLIKIGSVKVASCNGQGGAITDFPTIVSGGGYNTVIATSIVICGSGTSTITAIKNPAPTSATTYKMYDAATGGTLLQTITISSPPYVANFATPTLTSTTNYFIEATTSAGTTPRRQVIVTVNPTPTAPTVGIITQPTCLLSTGSVVLNGLPATGTWTLTRLPGVITGTGTGTTTTISGLAAGTYTFTVSNASSCASSVSANVLINAQPAINVWNGSVSTDWNNPANWCAGVPSVSNNADVLIPTNPTGGRYPKIHIEPAASGYANNIVFESGTTLIIENNTLFVDGSLTLNGRIDLNNEAQLVQGALSTFVAASSGSIEIDQQGTSDNFKYNYWGSPVNSTGTAYTIAGVLWDGTDPNALPLKPITFGAPYAFADGVSPLVGEAIKLSTYWMYKYANLGNGYSGWTSAGKDGSLKIGEGFTMKGSNTNLSEQNYTFSGKPNNGDIILPIAANRDYLIGNPYPSALDAKEFIRDNIAAPSGYRTVNVIDGNLYFWDHFGGGNHLLKSYEGGYGIVNLTGEIKAMATDALINNTGNESTKIPPRFIPVAQGFFVTSFSGIVGTENIQFKNSQRIFKKENPAISQFMKSAKYSKSNKETINEEVFPKIFLKYSSPKGFHRQLLVGFIENTTDGVDIGYDAINYETFAEDMSWRTNNVNFIIQAVPSLNDERILPIEVKVATAGIIKISIDKAENIPVDTEIFMKDNTTEKVHTISKTPFEIELPAGKYADRFALIFKTQKLVAEDITAEILIPAARQPVTEGISVFMNKALGELQIQNNSAEEIVGVALRNALGQTVKTWNSNFKAKTISLPISITTGVYLVQINTKTGKTVKKISVE